MTDERMNEGIYIREQRAKAKKRTKINDMTHMQNLHAIAVEEGYRSWKELTDKNK